MDEIELELIKNMYYGSAYKTINPSFLIQFDGENYILIVINNSLTIKNTNLFEFESIDLNKYKVNVLDNYKTYKFYKTQVKKLELSKSEELWVMSKVFKNELIITELPEEIRNKVKLKLENTVTILN